MKRFGLWGLGGADGCACTEFSLYNITVSVSCHKSERTIRVSCPSMERDPRSLEALAVEAMSQLRDRYEYEEPFAVRFCEYSYDHVNGHREGTGTDAKWVKQQKCCYCGALRDDPKAYLCEKCVRKREALAYYPWSGNESEAIWKMAAPTINADAIM
jgi:hypothetical protein